MSHYFLTPEEPLVTHEFTATVFGRELTFTAAPGVFSGHRLDLGTSVLLRSVEPPTTGHVLDLGCGVGTIAVGLAVASPGITVDAVDVNDRAVELTSLNAADHGVGLLRGGNGPRGQADDDHGRRDQDTPVDGQPGGAGAGCGGDRRGAGCGRGRGRGLTHGNELTSGSDVGRPGVDASCYR